MNVKTMRRADRWLGVPLCFLLTLARRVVGLFRRRPPGPPRRILVVKLAEQGATVLAYPALRKAVEAVGRENVFFLVFAENRFILDLMEVVPLENVIPIRTNGFIRVAADSLRAILRMRRERIDSAVDLEFFARSSAAFTYLSGARRRVGFHAFHGEASYRGDLMTHRLSFNPFLHASQIFQLQLQALNVSSGELPALDLKVEVDPSLPEVRPTPEERAQVEQLLQKLLGRESVPPLILLNANCSDLLPLRRWPTDRYIALTRRLLERYPEAVIAFTGSPEEAELAQGLVEQISSDRCASMAGRTTLRQLIVLYCMAEVLVTNDSGPAHYATLTPVDVVTLFGPETPAVFGSRSLKSHILWANLPCSPCVNAFNDRQSACPNNACMQRISLEEVFQQVCRIYEGRRKKPVS